jgi:hypothetical protein
MIQPEIENNPTEYLICQLIENAELKEILILQPHLINNLEGMIGDEVKSKRVQKLPGRQDLKLLALKMMKTKMNRICICRSYIPCVQNTLETF